MGGKCLSSNKKHEEKQLAYPKFNHINTESAVLTKFKNPSCILTKMIPLNPQSKLPFDALVCKIATDHYFIVGGVKFST
jgi:hypothetical protein